jgi:hypothetical protein
MDQPLTVRDDIPGLTVSVPDKASRQPTSHATTAAQ